MAPTGKTLYTGNFRHSIDDKGRLTIPSLWRAAHADTDQFLATPNPDGYISVLPPAAVESLYAKIAAVPLSDAAAQAEIAAFFAVAQAFTFDKQGRIALSAALLKHADIAKDAVLNGSFTKFNIYSPERWSLVEQRSNPASQADFLRRYQI
ncbi:MAG: mraZ [Opitutae bacterium]|nr:mraZ [Opitutae bacterium]